MNFLKNIGKAVENAANYVGEKNRRAAALNRIRGVTRCEEKAAEKRAGMIKALLEKKKKQRQQEEAK